MILGEISQPSSMQKFSKNAQQKLEQEDSPHNTRKSRKMPKNHSSSQQTTAEAPKKLCHSTFMCLQSLQLSAFSHKSTKKLPAYIITV